MNNLKGRWLTLLLSLAMMIAFVPMSMTTAYAAAGDEPDHAKTLTDNKDGTYKLSLDVTGEAEKQPNNVNVIVIVDRSGSMGERTGGYGSPTRMAATKSAVNDLASTLLSYNGKDGNPDDTVEMALVSFATTAQTNVASTTSSNTFTNAVTNLSVASGNAAGTNWEAALKQADTVSFGDTDPTFVIFFSDGSPTFYNNSQGGTAGSGYEQEPNMSNSYNAATDDAAALATKVGKERFYTIFAYGTTTGATYMRNLTEAAGAPAANNYSASDTEALEQAFAEILAKIEMSGIGNVEIDDGTTNKVATSSGFVDLLEVDTSSFKYYRDGVEWSDAPEAKLVDGEVKWDLSELGVLDNGVKYTVTFDVYPSQTALDYKARIENGENYEDVVPAEAREYFGQDGGLKTNTTATLSYDDTRDEEDQQEVEYTNPKPVATNAQTLVVNKEWEGEDADVDSLKMTVLMDGNKFHETELKKSEGWKSSSFISVGIIKNGQVLSGAEGHDFTFAELDNTQYHWELDAPTVHPMLVNGTLTMLVKVDGKHPAPSGAATYKIGNDTYYADSSAAGLTAKNHRRSNLNLSKKVTGEDAPEDAAFPFTLTVNNSKAEGGSADDTNSDYYVWFSIYDTSAGAPVTDATVSGATGPNDDGFYYAPSGSAITVNMKDGWNLRFTNLPSGTTYEFEEGTLPEGFAFNKAELTDGNDTSFKGAQKSTGTIQETKTSYQVEYTNDYQFTDLEITKVWVDNNDQDGMRTKLEDFASKLTLTPAVEGATPEVTKKDDNTYTIKYTGLPRFNNGKEVEYSVAESAIDGYTTEGSPAKDKGAITNTHTPEKTSVTAEKVWEDADNQDGIRPDSVSVQLKADGKAQGAAVTLDASNGWKNTWSNLDKFANGKEIVYTVEESAVTGYETAYSDIKDGKITVTNTHKPAETEYTATKVWNDADYVGKPGYTQPTEVEVTLTGTVPGENDGKTTVYTDTQKLNAGNEWKYKWTKLAKKSGGVDITYEVTEKAITGYNVTYDQANGTVTNTPVGKEDVIEPVTLNIEKKDKGTGNALAGAKFEIEGLGSVTTDKDGKASFTFTKAGTYTMTETAPTGYTATPNTWTIVVSQSGVDKVEFNGEKSIWQWFYHLFFDQESEYKNGVLTILNTPNTIEVPVTKIWNDKNNQDGKRPASITVTLYEAGKATTKTLTLNEGNKWAGKFTDLPEYKDGQKVAYSVVEDGVATLPDGYTAAVTGDQANGFTVTNSYNTETVNVAATKVWDDKNFEGKAGYTRPTEVKFNLLADGTKIDTQTKTVNEASEWKASWTGLDKYKDGKVIAYTVTEDALPNYTTAITGDAATGFTVTNTPKTVEVDTNTEAAVQKQVVADGTAWAGENGKKFSFTIAAGEGAPAPENASAELTFKKAETQTINFGKIVFTKPGTYEYTVTEAAPGDGWTCETSPQKFTVTVTMDKDGKLVAAVDKKTIKNTYKPEGTLDTDTDAQAVLKKTVVADGKAWAPKTFDFTIAVAEDSPEGTPTPEKAAGTATFDEAGTKVIGFGKIKFTKAGTYKYVVTETTEGGKGWTCDNEPKTVTVNVVDNGDGTLTATVDPKAAVITNEYKPTGDLDSKTSAILTKTVQAEGKDWAPKTFDFTIAAVNGAPLGKDADGKEVTKGTATFNEAGTQTIDFGKFTFTKAGEYKYTVKETTASGKGWTCDTSEKEITITVVDNGDGTLTATPTAASITNVYNTAGDLDTSVSPVLTKTVKADGKAWAPKTFDFTIAAVEGAPLAKDEDGKDITSGTATFNEAGTQNIDFGTIKYTKAGTYKYTVTETTKSGNGWVCDNEAKEVIVTVKDNGDGTLTASATAASITNEYKPSGDLDTGDDASAVLTKTVTADGTAWAPKTFDFTIAAVDGAPLAKDEDGKDITSGTATFSKAETKTIDFGTIKYTKAGTYKYTVTETTKSGDGWVCDNNPKDVVVTVTDDGHGKLTAEVTTKAEIENKYEPTGTLDTSVSIVLNKTVVADGTEWGPKTFEFTIAPVGEAPAATQPNGTATFTEAGTKPINFGTITFTKAGTYQYTVTETTKSGDGWTCDNEPKTVTVNVTDDGKGKLTASVEEAQLITNEYKPEGTLDTKTTAVLTKTVQADGTAWADKKFDFTIAAVTPGAPAPTKTEGSATFSAKGTQVIDFGTITFTKAGEYEYTVTETTQSGEGWTCDNAPKTVKITVTDNGNGTLTATPEAVDIKNVYEAKPVKTQIKVTKTVEGYKTDEGSADDTYVMTLAAEGDAPMPAEAESGVVTTNGKGENLFGEIEYTEPGEYKYTVTEKAGEKAGVTYDETTYNVTVTVEDNGKGQLVATVDYGKGSSTSGEEEAKTSVDVTNTFAVESVDVVMSVTKQIDDQSNSAEDATFKFVLKDADKKELQTKEVTTEDLKGSVDFDKVTFDHDGEYTFYIQESVSEEDAAKLGWTYDTNEYPVVVKISDNLSEAKLVKDGVTYDNDKTELVVTNIYKAEPTTVSDITVKKTIEDTSGSAYETTFTFTLEGKDNAPMPDNNKASVTGEGEVTFAGIKYEKAGTYNYTVTEEASGDAGYQYDSATYNVVVTVKDEGGKLVASVDYGKDEETGEAKTEIDVINTYDPEDVNINLTALKLINDKTGSAPDATFTFELLDGDGNVVETVEHENGGAVAFKTLTFSKVGTYSYTIREVAGDAPGYSYDTAEHKVTITVTDPDKDGILKAKVEGNSPEIENPYEVDPGKKSVTDQIPVTKVLSGRDLEAGEFTFVLKQADGDTKITATNDANGAVVFAPVTFNKVGEYVFTVSEVQGDLEDVTYDNTIYTVIATVTDPHTGDALEVNWTCNEGNSIVFNNEYEPPEEPEEPDEPDKPKKPDTGDSNNIGGWLALMLLAGAGGTGLYVKRRRDDQ